MYNFYSVIIKQNIINGINSNDQIKEPSVKWKKENFTRSKCETKE